MKKKKLLSWVMTVVMLLSVTLGTQTAFAFQPTISTSSTLYAGEDGFDKVMLTLENDTFLSTITKEDISVSIGGIGGSFDFTLDDETHITIEKIKKDVELLEAGDEVEIFIKDSGVGSNTISNVLSLAVQPTRNVKLETENPKMGKVGETYSYTFTAEGIVNIATFKLLEGEVPDGLTLGESGNLTGTPSRAGSYTFTVKATDADIITKSDTHEYTMIIESEGEAPIISTDSALYEGEEDEAPIISTDSVLCEGEDENNYMSVFINVENNIFKNQLLIHFSAEDKEGNNINNGFSLGNSLKKQVKLNIYSVDGNRLKEGDKISIYFESGAFENTTNKSNTILLTVQPTRTLALDKSPMAPAIEGKYYIHQFEAVGGTRKKSFKVSRGELPRGLKLSNSGELRGIVGEKAGQFTFTVMVTDDATPATTDSYEYTLIVKDEETGGDYLHIDGRITKYVGREKDIAIPSEIDGKPITVIGKNAFEDFDIESIIVPDGIETIEKQAFVKCPQLKSVVIGKSVKNIGQDIIRCSGNNFVRVIFTGKPPMMENDAFLNCDLNENFKIYYPSNETGYGPNWQGYTCIAYDATATYNVIYDGNGNSGGVLHKDNREYYTGDSFTVPLCDITKLENRFNGWNTKADGTGDNYDSGDIVTVAAENITLYAMWDKIYTITKDPTLKNGSISIYVNGKEASQAAKNDKVKIVVRPNQGYRYEPMTLCYYIKETEIINSIDESMIMPLEPTEKEYEFIMTDNNITVDANFEPDTTKYSKGVILDYYFIKRYYGSGGNIFISSSIDGTKVLVLYGRVFYNQHNLTGVSLSQGITQMGGPVFYGCHSLRAVELPESLEVIEQFVFKNCGSLESIRIPNKVYRLGVEVFSQCPMLRQVCFEGDAPEEVFQNTFKGANPDLVIYCREDAKGFNVAPWTDFTIKSYKHLVKYKDNGAESGIVPREHILIDDGLIQIKENSGGLVKSGYRFDGWNTKADGSGTNYAVGESVKVSEDKVLYANWRPKRKSSDSSSGTKIQPTTPTKATGSSNVEAKADQNGKVIVTEKQILDAMAQAEKNSEGVVTITVNTTKDIKSIETKIPDTAIAALAEKMSKGIGVVTPIAELNFDQRALKSIKNGAIGDLKILVERVESNTLSQEGRQLIVNRPIYRFSVTRGDKVISQFDGTVTVSIPYIPSEDEDVNTLVIYSINEDGKLEMVKDCVYDAKTDRIIFKTNHFSQYAVGNNKVVFHDVTGWYKDSVAYLASRNIIKGKNQGYFMPNDNITRAEFVQILANMSGNDVSKYGHSAFGDVGDKDWFFQAVAWAKDNGVVSGSGGNFNPNAYITREEMAVIIERYVTKVANRRLEVIDNSNKFADEEEIADYAKTAVETMKNSGMIAGKENHTFAPKENATRAEGAKMLSTVMQRFIKD